MKIAIVGCGNIGRAHARAYQQQGEVDTLLCLDVSRERAEAFAGEFDGKAGVFPDDLPGDVDGASVTTPPGRHYAVVKHLLEAGIPTFCEKPLTTDIGEGDELVRLAREQDVPLLVGFKMRFERVFQMARERLPDLGRLYGISVTKCQPYHPRPSEDWVPGVGALFELSSHDLDLVHWLTALRPASVAAKLDRNEGWDADTRFFLQVAYEGGVVGQFMGGYSEEANFWYRDLTMSFVGERGYIRIERPDRLVCHLEEFEVIELGEVETNTFPREVENFLGVIRGEAAPFVTPEEAHLITQLVQTARRSAEEGRPLRIPGRVE